MLRLHLSVVQGRVAQWIRASDSGSVGRGFESLHARLAKNYLLAVGC